MNAAMPSWVASGGKSWRGTHQEQLWLSPIEPQK
ncbi:hypothetical protein BX264_5397 [Streptomyces sp. 2333.5]|nr:hypothetical protein BX264_5397 [Streptomyces sp. 2333.5]SEE65160.1 hypothetical protein SAMN05428943_5505 [Streptomyces sp. 2314.4]SEE91703.1 hypothetical protein SAMN05428942_5500 [Streptomyces sp. 2112.2]